MQAASPATGSYDECAASALLALQDLKSSGGGKATTCSCHLGSHPLFSGYHLTRTIGT